MTYTVAVTFTTDDHTDEHLRTAEAIEAEFQSWLEGLGAAVLVVNVQSAGEED